MQRSEGVQARQSPRQSETAENKVAAPLPTLQLLRTSAIDLTSLRLATQGCITEYDVVSGCKMDSVELPMQTPVNLQYLGDAVTLAFVTQERHLMTFNWLTRRLRTLYVAGDTKGDTHAMTHMHLAVHMGPRQVLFVSKHGSQAVRMVLPQQRPAAAKAKGKDKGGDKEKDGSNGLKYYCSQKKPIIGIAAHPAIHDVVIVAFSDGSIAACQFAAKTTTLATLWTITVDDKAGQLMRAALKAERHPFNPRSSLLVAGTNIGALVVWEMPDGQEPRKLGHYSSMDGTALIGAGVVTSSCLLVCFLKNLRGELSSKAWRIASNPVGGTLLTPVDLYPEDMWAAVEGAKPKITADAVSDATFWKSLRSSQNAASFVQYSGATRTGYDVARIVIHPQGYMLAQMLPLKQLLPLRSKMAEKIDAGSVEAVQKVLHAPVLRLWDVMHPPNGSLAPDVVPMHLDLECWTPQGDDEPNTKLRLLFPKDIAMLDVEAVRQYNLMAGSLTTLAQFPKSANLLAHRIVYSDKQKAWLIFFNNKTVKSLSESSEGDSEYAIILQSNVMQLSMGTMDTSPGLSGTFCGAIDEFYAILGNDMKLVYVYQTLGARVPLSVVQLPGSGSNGLFNAGPLMAAISAIAPPPEEEEGKKKKKKKDDKEPPEPKWFLWARDGTLQLGDVSQASGKVNTPQDVTMKLGKGVKLLGQMQATKSVVLNVTEKVLQICWQPLGSQETGSLTHPQGTSGHACLGAIVTTERVLVVDGDLQPLASNSPQEPNVQVLSCLWAGPALFFSTSAEEVYQFNWGGAPMRCFALSNGSPCTLAGALVDRLLVATRVQGVTQVMCRYFNIAPALLVGWAGLATSGALTGGMAKARKAMAKILRTYDSSTIEAQQLASLADAGFADVALQIVRGHLSSKIAGARHAQAVDKCNAEVKALLKEYQGSVYKPRAPPRSSILYHRLVRCGRKATLCCAFSAARNAFTAAGQVTELIPVLVALNDKHTLRNICEAVEVHSTMMMECSEIATLLYAVPPHVLNKVPLDADPIGNSSLDGSFQQVWGGTDLAPIGTQPAMLAAYSQNDRGSIVPLDRTQLKHWVEIEAVHVGDAGPGPRVGLASKEPSDAGTPTPDIEFEDDANTTPASGTPQGSFTMQDNEKWSSDEESAGKVANAARGPSAPSPSNKSDDFDSSDEEQQPKAPKFRITIKSKDEAARSTSTADLSRAAQSLRSVKWAGGPATGGSMAFLPPPSGIGGLSPQRAAPMAPGQSNRPAPLAPLPVSMPFDGGAGSRGSSVPSPATAPLPSPVADGDNVDALLDFLGSNSTAPPPPPQRAPAASRQPAATGLDLFADISGSQGAAGGPRSGPASSAAPARTALRSVIPGPSGQAYVNGMQLMEAGKWEEAAVQLQRSWEGTAQAVSGGSQAALGQFQTVIHCITGIKLMVAAAKATPAKAARYGRYAIMLKVPDMQRVPIVQKSVEYNMKAGNYGFCSELLMWLVTTLAGVAPDSVLNQIQQQMAHCDANRNANAALPKEDLAGFVASLAGVLVPDDISRKLRPVLTS